MELVRLVSHEAPLSRIDDRVEGLREKGGARLETSLAARRGEGARTGAAGAVGEERRLLDSGGTLGSGSQGRLGRSQLEPRSRSHVGGGGLRGHRLGGGEAGAANLVAEALAHEDGTVASHVDGRWIVRV